MSDTSSGADGADAVTLRRRMLIAGTGAAAGSMGVHAVAAALRTEAESGRDDTERDGGGDDTTPCRSGSPSATPGSTRRTTR